MAQGPRARFNDFISQIITSQEVDGSELLIIIGMLRERTLREEFLECLHNHAPCFRLSQSSYYNLLDIMRALLREANNSGDYKSIASMFASSRLYGKSVGSFMFTILKSLTSHEAWSNVAFWLHCTDEIISYDVSRWRELPSKSKKLLSFPECQVNSFLVINRIQAVAFGSMRAVGVPSEIIRRYIDTACENHGLSAAKIDMTLSPSREFVMWLLDLAIEQEQKESNTDTDDSSDYVPQKIDIDTRSKRMSLGFSSLQELIFVVAMRTGRRAGDSPAPSSDLCVCGLPLGVWQPLGLFDDRISHRQNAPTVLCEGCFRQATSSLVTAGDIVGDIGRCVVPDTAAVRPKTFLGIYYGRKAEKSEFRGTTGENVMLDALEASSSTNQMTKKNSFVRSDRVEEKSDMKMSRNSREAGRQKDAPKSSLAQHEDDDSVFSTDTPGLPNEGESAPRDRIYAATKGKLDKKGSEKEKDEEATKRLGLRKFLSLMRSGVDVVKISNNPITRHITRTLFLDKEAQRLCWLPPGRAALTPEIRHSIPIDSIKSIKIGSGKFEQCINIVGEQKSMLIKVEDTKMFAQLVEGFLLITENNRNSHQS